MWPGRFSIKSLDTGAQWTHWDLFFCRSVGPSKLSTTDHTLNPSGTYFRSPRAPLASGVISHMLVGKIRKRRRGGERKRNARRMRRGKVYSAIFWTWFKVLMGIEWTNIAHSSRSSPCKWSRQEFSMSSNLTIHCLDLFSQGLCSFERVDWHMLFGKITLVIDHDHCMDDLPLLKWQIM